MSTKHLFYVLVSSHPVEANRIFKKYSGQYSVLNTWISINQYKKLHISIHTSLNENPTMDYGVDLARKKSFQGTHDLINITEYDTLVQSYTS